MRVGGDEFVCALPDATLEVARRRFDEASERLAAGPTGGSITVGFAQLKPDDSLADLIKRADAELLAARGRR